MLSDIFATKAVESFALRQNSFSVIPIFLENCDILYEQTYFFWANYDADFSVIPENKYSFFYAPYVALKIIDAPHDAFIEKMMKMLEKLPIYSTAYDADIPENEDLDILTYDRVIGKIYSTSPLDD